MKLREKTATLLIAIFMISTLAVIVPTMAQQSISVPIHQAQFQWRAWDPMPSGSWTELYQNSQQTIDGTLSGNVLHSSWSYAPWVSEETGASTVYVYNKKADVWIEREGKVTYKYTPYYGEYTALNFFRGYIDSPETFSHGVAYQWIYLDAPEDDTGVMEVETDYGTLQYAEWDSKVGAWLVGFSVYIWDTRTYTQSYALQFPDPLIEPLSANIYNHLDL